MKRLVLIVCLALVIPVFMSFSLYSAEKEKKEKDELRKKLAQAETRVSWLESERRDLFFSRSYRSEFRQNQEKQWTTT